MLPLARGNSCGGALERVAWATLRRRSGEDGGHRVKFEAVVWEGIECQILVWVEREGEWRLA